MPGIIFQQDIEKFAHFPAKILIEFGSLGEKSHSKMQSADNSKFLLSSGCARYSEAELSPKLSSALFYVFKVFRKFSVI